MENHSQLVVEQLVGGPVSYSDVYFSFQGPNTQHGEKRLTDVTENVLKRLCIDSRGNLVWGQSAVDAEEVCGETSNVRSGHGSTRDRIGPPVVPSGSDVQAGSKDIDGGTIIGEVGPLIIDIRGGDGDRLLSAGRGVVARIVVIVSGGYDDGDAAVVKLEVESLVSSVTVTFRSLGAYRFDGLVHTCNSTATQAHRSNSGSTGVQCFFGDPEHPGDTVVR